MTISKVKARKLLREHDLRATAPRIAVLRVLAAANRPLSHGEVLARLGQTDWDPATIYRNLVKLRQARLAPVVSRAQGIDRYALSPDPGSPDQGHRHPHFLCDDCGQIACLPDELHLKLPKTGRWAASVEEAVVQLRGECPDCRERGAAASAQV